ncbi:hypothetical protein GOBAR_DD06119 [Gossypium barbadense]|nr:hypothetical protein GOBAR_DD06119 [Gossypium barbadense]
MDSSSSIETPPDRKIDGMEVKVNDKGIKENTKSTDTSCNGLKDEGSFRSMELEKVGVIIIAAYVDNEAN